MKQEIQTEGVILEGETEVLTRDLPPEARIALGTWLKETYLGELLLGKGTLSRTEGAFPFEEAGTKEEKREDAP